MSYGNILIIADIEGGSGCWSRRAGMFMTKEWPEACLGMTLDVDAVVRALFEAGVERVAVKDFHRTGYNLIPDLLHPRARLIPGYKQGSVPGLGDPGHAEAVMFLGMHAASGTSGFLAHTMTSRIARLQVNGSLIPEVSLFASSLAPHGLRPIFFSGCPVSCRQAEAVIPGLRTHPIEKSRGPAAIDAPAWRAALAKAAVASLSNRTVIPHEPQGPFHAVITMRDGAKAARKHAGKWSFPQKGPDIFIDAPDIHALFMDLIRLCYLTPLVEKTLPLCLPLYNLMGRLGIEWVRRRPAIRKFIQARRV
ncbi:MAG: M55 family metallopeptidase [Desulfobacterales bacterium]|nr:M55 family metallopeptidase [Desulfobacterales bacterium]